MNRLAAANAVIVLLATGCSGGPTPATPAPTRIDTALTFAEFASADVRQAAQTYPDIALELEAPLSLTTSDGTGLEMVRLHGRAIIDGPLAFTELRLRFRNPEARVLEGRFSITLPDDAAISRLAMRIDGAWQEAEVVERQLAHRAYEDFLHRRQDPALLEKEAGNQFRARIFPIPANGVKDIIVSYSHVVAQSEQSYVIPLRGLPEIAELDLAASVRTANGKTRRVALADKNVKPERDFVAPLAGVADGLRSGRHAAVRIAPKIAGQATRIGALTILFDTSASRAPGFAKSISDLGTLVKKLSATHGSRLELTVAAFDQETQRIFSGRAADFGDKELALLRARRPLGASDLGQAFAWLASTKPSGRLLIIGDGIATAGKTDAGPLKKALAAISTLERVDAILVGGIRDRALGAALVRGTFQKDGAVIDGGTSVDEQARRVALETRSNIRVAVDGARWTWPSRIDGIQAGEEVVIFAEMAKPTTKKVAVRLTGGVNETVNVATQSAIEPLIVRQAAVAEIARLSAERQASSGTKAAVRRDQLKKQIVDISTRHRVLSDFTALLVLETDDDYRRFGIDRTALSKIMTIGAKGIELSSRGKPLTIASPTNRPANERDDPDANDEGDAGADGEMREKGKLNKKTGNVDFKDKPEPEAKAPAPADPGPSPAKTDMADADKREVPDNDADGIPDSYDRADDDDDDDDESDSAGRVASEAPREEDSERSEFEANLRSSPPAFTGRMATIMALVDKQDSDRAIAESLAWRNDEPGDVMALIALGTSLELAGNHRIAARAYGSIIDLFPSRADLRRFAGARLQRLRDGAALAGDTFAKAVEQRPDHLTGYRLHAYALVRAGRLAEAFAAAESGLEREFPGGRFSGGKRILSGDLTLIAAAWIRQAPGRRADIERRLAKHNLRAATKPSLRFVLNWETDANDVDFHIFDGSGGHAYYSSQELPSGGELYEDITNGYGPECFAIEGPAKAYPYKLQIHYYSRGPMGYGMGQVEILHHDGQGNLSFQERPFVVMSDSAYLDLGVVHPPTATQSIAK